MRNTITPDMLVKAYASGVFPMAESRDSEELLWLSPRQRGVIPLDRFHVPSRLARTLRQDPYRITANLAFDAVIEACAADYPERTDTWINADILRLYKSLHQNGLAHSIECWLGDTLVGGLYGVSLSGAFFGESMFHTATDASKIALVHLVARLKKGGYTLLDAQFMTAHLKQFGTEEIPQSAYMGKLAEALTVQGFFGAAGDCGPGVAALGALQPTTQTSKTGC